MQINNRWIFLVLMIFIGVLLGACGQGPVTSTKVEPAYLEPVEGSDFLRVVLTEQAAKRLDIQTSPVREELIDGTLRMVIPYSSVLYGLNGETWVYVNGDSLSYVRAPVGIEYIDGDMAVLLEGPSLDTHVVTVGVAELYGTETGVGK